MRPPGPIEVEIGVGEITRVARRVAAVVSPENPFLAARTGVAPALRRAAWTDDLERQRRSMVGWPAARSRLSPGKAVVTGAGRLGARHLAHAVVLDRLDAPVAGAMRPALRGALDLCEAVGADSVAIPLFGDATTVADLARGLAGALVAFLRARPVNLRRVLLVARSGVYARLARRILLAGPLPGALAVTGDGTWMFDAMDVPAGQTGRPPGRRRRADFPLPVADLIRRAHNARSPKERHDLAYHAWEASVRLAVAARPPADARALARPAMGHWVAATRCDETRLRDADLLASYRLLCAVGIGRRVAPELVTARRVLDAVPAYRNATIGHAAPRDHAFYEQAGDVLLAGIEAAWRLGVFWPPDGRLAYVDAVWIDDREVRGRVVDLTGPASWVADRRGTPCGHALVPGHLYLLADGRYRDLYPWLLYRDVSERVLFFNGVSSTARYLDFSSGEELRGSALAKTFPTINDDLAGLFGPALTRRPR